MLSARIPASEKLSVFAAPIISASCEASSATSSAACLCGIVTLAPTNPSPGIARTRAANFFTVTSIAS